MLNLTGTLITCPTNRRSRRAAYPNHYWHGEEGHLKDEVEQSCSPSGIVVEMIKAACDIGATMIHILATDGKVPIDWEQFHCLPLQGQGWCSVQRQPSSPQADRAGYEDPREDCWWSHKTDGLHWWLPVWLCPRRRHYRCNLCGPAAAGTIPSSEQEALYGLLRPRESIWPWPSDGYLVSPEKLGVEEWIVQLVQGMYPCWQGFQPRVWGEGWGPPGIGTQSLALNHCAGGLVTWVLGWCSLGGPICRWSCHHCWLPRGMMMSGDSWYGKKPWRRRGWG